MVALAVTRTPTKRPRWSSTPQIWRAPPSTASTPPNSSPRARKPDMRVILRSDLDGLGKRGDIVEVSDGHARNFLLPKGHALVASDGAVDQAARMRKARDTRDSSAREAATAIASKLVPMVITVPAKAGPEGKLFGSVTSGDIVAAVLTETGIELERRQLEVDTIKTIGQHTVTASLHSDVSFPIRVDVVAAD